MMPGPSGSNLIFVGFTYSGPEKRFRYFIMSSSRVSGIKTSFSGSYFGKPFWLVLKDL